MKLFSIQILRREVRAEPSTLAASYDLSSTGFFQRTAVREMINFVAKTIVQRTQPGQRVSVEHEGYICHVHVRHDGLAGVVVADSEYKSRVAFVLLTKLLEDFDRELCGTVTPPTDWSPLQIVEYRDPTNVDSISAIEKDLDETMVVLAQTIENVLARGEKLDDLVAKSQELSAQSKVFYKHAASTTSCCIVM